MSSTVLRTLQVPEMDAKGRPVRNPVTGAQATITDQDALKSFYTWASENGKKPTATQFAQWEAQGRPGANKNPQPASGAPKIGTVENGYRFKGGDPALPGSWEKMR